MQDEFHRNQYKIAAAEHKYYEDELNHELSSQQQ